MVGFGRLCGGQPPPPEFIYICKVSGPYTVDRDTKALTVLSRPSDSRGASHRAPFALVCLGLALPGPALVYGKGFDTETS